MKGYILFSGLGLVIMLSGVGLLVYNLETRGTIAITGAAAVVALVGGALLFIAGKKSAKAYVAQNIDLTPSVVDEAFASTLEKKNEMMKDYKKASYTRDQLKVLEVASAGQQQK